MTFFRIFYVFLMILVAGWGLEAQAQFSTGDEYLKEMNAIADALEGVHDQASAEQAAAAMAVALARMEPLVDEIDCWSDAEKRTFFIGQSAKIQGAHQRISSALMQMVRNPEYMDLFIEQMKNMPKFEAPQ